VNVRSSREVPPRIRSGVLLAIVLGVLWIVSIFNEDMPLAPWPIRVQDEIEGKRLFLVVGWRSKEECHLRELQSKADGSTEGSNLKLRGEDTKGVWHPEFERERKG